MSAYDLAIKCWRKVKTLFLSVEITLNRSSASCMIQKYVKGNKCCSFSNIIDGNVAADFRTKAINWMIRQFNFLQSPSKMLKTSGTIYIPFCICLNLPRKITYKKWIRSSPLIRGRRATAAVFESNMRAIKMNYLLINKPQPSHPSLLSYDG